MSIFENLYNSQPRETRDKIELPDIDDPEEEVNFQGFEDLVSQNQELLELVRSSSPDKL